MCPHATGGKTRLRLELALGQFRVMVRLFHCDPFQDRPVMTMNID